MFRSGAEMAEAFGYRFGGKAFAGEFAVATAYSWHNHECFHLYASLLGHPPRIFVEGMAVAHEFDPYNGVWVSQWNRAEPHRVVVAYEQAGAWVSHLVETYGLESMKRIFATIPQQASRDTTRSQFEAVYGVSVAEAEAAWLAWLDRLPSAGRPPSDVPKP